MKISVVFYVKICKADTIILWYLNYIVPNLFLLSFCHFN